MQNCWSFPSNGPVSRAMTCHFRGRRGRKTSLHWRNSRTQPRARKWIGRRKRTKKRRRRKMRKTRRAKGEGTTSSRLQPLVLDPIRSEATWLPEPSLTFANSNAHPDPKVGIPLYGPRSLNTPRHKSEVHLGFIGPAEAVESARKFYEHCASGVSGDYEHAPFPGCDHDHGYRCDLRFNASLVEPITRQELLDLAGHRRRRDKFEFLLSLCKAKMQILTQRDQPLDY